MLFEKEDIIAAIIVIFDIYSFYRENNKSLTPSVRTGIMLWDKSILSSLYGWNLAGNLVVIISSF